MAHNFISNNSTVRYQEVLYCPKCGYVAWSANDSGEKQRERQAHLPSRCVDDTVISAATSDHEPSTASKNAKEGSQ